MSDELVSAIVIFLDERRFLREAIESIFAQTYQNWELLLIDDGSKDGSSEIARCIAAQYPEKVRYFEHTHHRNLGMSASRNLGVHHAKGPYIAFLDADDVWLPTKLEQQLAILHSHPTAAMVFGPVQWWYSWSGQADDLKRDFVARLNGGSTGVVEPPQFLVSLLTNEGVTTTASLIRREAIISAGGFEEIFRGLYEDQAFCAKICSKAAVYVAEACWYKWRKHSDSSCSDAVTRGHYQAARLGFLTWLQQYLSQAGLMTAELSTTLTTEIRQCRDASLNRVWKWSKNSKWMKDATIGAARRVLPAPVRRWLSARVHGREYVPPVGWVRFGSFRRIEPFSRAWGTDRGMPVDRYYIETFLSEHSRDISGHVLEIGDDRYTRKFGRDQVIKSDVLHVLGNSQTTIVADLTNADSVPSEVFDCVICTQTLPFIYDVRAAIQTLHRILKPGGILLASVPGGTHQISRSDMEQWGDYWRFTSLSTRMLLKEIFPEPNIQLKAYGNVMAATAFINGLSAEDLSRKELDRHDPDYEVLIVVRAIKPQDIG